MAENNKKPTLWYFADPMCSWCWGFSPVMEKIRLTYNDDMDIALNLGGLRPGTQHAITVQERDEILHHWRSVNDMTGQKFKFEQAMPEGFIYDTEPASRLMALIASVDASQIFSGFIKIQKAFYENGQDVTSVRELKKIAESVGITGEKFDEKFDSSSLKEATAQHFESTYRAGIRGFPALVWQDGEYIEKLCSGYVPYETISNNIDQCIKRSLLV